MGKKLAIRGHATRGKEVIELLEMMGGSPAGATKGSKESYCYYISENTATKYISWDYIGPEEIDRYEIFTLEEFLKEYPHKVGDKVVDCYGNSLTIKSMNWLDDLETMVYDFEDAVIVLAAEDIRFAYDDMTEETITPTPDITANVTDKNNCDIQCPDGYEFYDENGNLIGTKVMMRPKKPKYPKTYKECCDVLNLSWNKCFAIFDIDHNGLTDEENNLYESLIKLKRCRDAYWKIAGEEMDLGKPWVPDWTNETTKYGIQVYQNTIIKDNFIRTNCAFVFPTPEIQDTFYENFKDLINECKELL